MSTRTLRSLITGSALVCLLGLGSMTPAGATTPTTPARTAPSAAAAKLDCESVSGNDSSLGTYYSLFTKGPKDIPAARTAWVPQGLAPFTAGGKDWLVISYYDSNTSNTQNSRLVFIDRVSRDTKKVIKLNTTGHVGGVAVGGGYVWVASDGKVQRISTTKILNAANYGSVSGTGITVKGSSYANYGKDGFLYVGNFYTDKMYRYGVSDGKLTYKATINTPSQVQGVAVTKGGYVFSRSCGRDTLSRISVQPKSQVSTSTFKAPNMSEGLAISHGKIYVVFESASDFYDDASIRKTSIHSATLSDFVTG